MVGKKAYEKYLVERADTVREFVRMGLKKQDGVILPPEVVPVDVAKKEISRWRS